MVRLTKIFLCTAITSLLLASCAAEGKKERSVQSVNSELVTGESDKVKVDRIKKIFYTLPSPLELTMLFKKEGVQYHADLLHSVSRRKDYHGSLSKSLNLGVYGADLSFSGLFGKHEAAIQYYAASQILAADLGIGNSFQQEFVSRLESNAGNKDTLLKVVSEFFLRNGNYLRENNHQNLSTMVLAGGWIEGMYLGTNILDEKANGNGIRNIITNQRDPLHNLIVLFQNAKTNDNTTRILEMLGELEGLYNEVEGDMTIEQFGIIKTKIAATRAYIISL